MTNMDLVDFLRISEFEGQMRRGWGRGVGEKVLCFGCCKSDNLRCSRLGDRGRPVSDQLHLFSTRVCRVVLLSTFESELVLNMENIPMVIFHEYPNHWFLKIS